MRNRCSCLGNRLFYSVSGRGWMDASISAIYQINSHSWLICNCVYEQARTSNISVDENFLREKALEIAASNGMDTFSASNGGVLGLFPRFKSRLGLVSRKLCGESATVLNTDGIEMWLEKLLKLLEGYKDCDIYKANEAANWPLDARIINCFKQFYRRKPIKKSLSFMEQAKESTPKKDILQAIHFVLSAWHEITSSAIQHCFVKCGYIRKNYEECLTEGQENDDDDDDNAEEKIGWV
ncbi:hypothetical protein NPIL_264771 [Nephila pilipes]|uniref:DDE-1 domain-containing protein n=1 Tax=Nephila pilipes TaxID=299642 RepID=A0A8X6NYB1_NEPPI|nr:hypothetical protein NPIL_264771 [Nephila pilipes]